MSRQLKLFYPSFGHAADRHRHGNDDRRGALLFGRSPAHPATFASASWHARRSVVPEYTHAPILAGYAVICPAVTFGALHSVAGLVAVALVMGILGYFTTSALEALNTRFTLTTGMASDRAARWMQTTIQIWRRGAGRRAAGTARHQCVHVVALCGGSRDHASRRDLVRRKGCRRGARREREAGSRRSIAKPARFARPENVEHHARRHRLSLSSYGTFNTLTPVAYQSINHWTAADFDMASAMAGIGAFCSAVLPGLRTSEFAAALSVVVMNAVLVFSGVSLLSIAACFGIGFGVNQLRIGLRWQLIELATVPADAECTASVSLLPADAKRGAAAALRGRVPTPSVCRPRHGSS
ncbi:hypothetical protein BPMI_04745 [Candidatus Burkholderia pumila]|uniref:Uncharacterized protein n=1 Tax=Candidatus Burkholderia pumila TaxID=1090375 RepID=A0ABR5HME3_9BURK|nr:hypothetical protein BPMI_04745 [Candidatus Burkholderia pumila]